MEGEQQLKEHRRTANGVVIYRIHRHCLAQLSTNIQKYKYALVRKQLYRHFMFTCRKCADTRSEISCPTYYLSVVVEFLSAVIFLRFRVPGD
jgi:hypothetical protein